MPTSSISASAPSVATKTSPPSCNPRSTTCSNGSTPSTRRPRSAANNNERAQLAGQLSALRGRLTDLQLEVPFADQDVQVLRRASPPTSPSSITLREALLIGLGVGLLLGVLAAFLLEFADDSIRTRQDLLRAAGTDLPVLGVIPVVARRRAEVVSMTQPSSPAAEAYRSLRTAVHFASADRDRCVAITTARSRHGKTETVTNLAVLAAQLGQRTVVVDCDMRSPRVHDFFDLPNDTGFTSVVYGEPLSNALKRVPGNDRLFVLPTGPIAPNPAELLASQRSAEVLASLQGDDTLVLVDTPPILLATDAAELAPAVGGILLVATARVTRKKQVRQAIEQLRQIDAPLLGMVLHRADSAETGGFREERWRDRRRARRRRRARATEVAAPVVSAGSTAPPGSSSDPPRRDRLSHARGDLIAGAGQDPVGPGLDRVQGSNLLPHSACDLAPVRRRQADQPPRERSRIVVGKAQFVREEVVERRARGEHGQARRRGFVDHLVRRARPRVVDQGVRVGEQSRHVAAGHRATKGDALGDVQLVDELVQLFPVALVAGCQRRPVVREMRVRDERQRAHDGLDALDRRVPAQRQEPGRPAEGLLHEGELGEIDPVPDRDELCGGQGERAIVDRHDGTRHALRQPQHAARVRVRVPEQQRNAQRPAPWCGDTA